MSPGLSRQNSLSSSLSGQSSRSPSTFAPTASPNSPGTPFHASAFGQPLAPVSAPTAGWVQAEDAAKNGVRMVQGNGFGGDAFDG
jgi:hypothetical protein